MWITSGSHTFLFVGHNATEPDCCIYERLLLRGRDRDRERDKKRDKKRKRQKEKKGKKYCPPPVIYVSFHACDIFYI